MLGRLNNFLPEFYLLNCILRNINLHRSPWSTDNREKYRYTEYKIEFVFRETIFHQSSILKASYKLDWISTDPYLDPALREFVSDLSDSSSFSFAFLRFYGVRTISYLRSRETWFALRSIRDTSPSKGRTVARKCS